MLQARSGHVTGWLNAEWRPLASVKGIKRPRHAIGAREWPPVPALSRPGSAHDPCQAGQGRDIMDLMDPITEGVQDPRGGAQ